MEKLTRYNSWEALKADTNGTVTTEQEIIERHLAMKQVLEKLRANYLETKKKSKKSRPKNQQILKTND